MNDHLKELANQALKKCDAINERSIEGYSDELARLIVLDCVAMVNKHQQYNNPNDCLLALDIKERFGL